MSEEKQENAAPQKMKLSGFGASMDLENVSLNTLFTIIGVLLIVLISFAMWVHREETKDTGQQLVGAIKEVVAEQKVLTQAMREANCLASLTLDERKRDSEFCKRITR